MTSWPIPITRFSFPWELELQGSYRKLVTRTVGRSVKSHSYFIHDYRRKLYARLGRVNKLQTRSHHAVLLQKRNFKLPFYTY